MFLDLFPNMRIHARNVHYVLDIISAACQFLEVVLRVALSSHAPAHLFTDPIRIILWEHV